MTWNDLANAHPELDQESIKLLQNQGANLGTSGDQLSNGLDVFKTSFKNTSGRDPTAEELNGYFKKSLLSQWLEPGNLNYTDATAGANNYINNNFDVTKLRQDYQKSQSPQQYDAVNKVVSSVLGRQATQDELDHYGGLLSSGQADAYQIGDFLKSTPEYQNAQDTNFRQGVDTQLQASDTNFFNTQKGNIAQQYAQMGRATSPALDVALTQLASQLNSNRGNYLAQLSASQYGGNKAAALGGYQNTQNQVQGQINQNTQNQYQQYQNSLARLNSTQDYNRQSQDFQRYADQMNNRNPSWMDYLNAGVNAGKGIAQGSAAVATMM